MKSNNLLYLAVVGMLLLFSSCAEQRNLVYFSDIQQSDAYQQAITNAHEPKIQIGDIMSRSEEHTSELQSRENLVCRLLLEKKKKNKETSRHEHRVRMDWCKDG